MNNSKLGNYVTSQVDRVVEALQAMESDAANIAQAPVVELPEINVEASVDNVDCSVECYAEVNCEPDVNVEVDTEGMEVALKGIHGELRLFRQLVESLLLTEEEDTKPLSNGHDPAIDSDQVADPIRREDRMTVRYDENGNVIEIVADADDSETASREARIAGFAEGLY